jgi:hypothetical protein
MKVDHPEADQFAHPADLAVPALRQDEAEPVLALPEDPGGL